jgi:succinate-semialdehyde dehydrogenase/glutarate-semialdehyde dehydrogenase
MNEAGLPPGVLNCVTGRGDRIGAALAGDGLVASVHLTGSDGTGRHMQRAAGSTGPALLLELAGSDAMIVCADADLPKALQGALVGRYRNAGQACIAVKRLYVATEIYDEFIGALSRLVLLRQPGDGLAAAERPFVRLGPVHTAAQRDLIEEQLESATREGAEVLVGGRRPPDAALAAGHFFEPTLVANVSGSSRLVAEEVFGPVLPVFRTLTLDDAMAKSNESPWDLNTSIWTSDRALARRVAGRIRCRQLWINRLPFGTEHAS